MLSLSTLFALVPFFTSAAYAQVTATGPNGPTNPSAPSFAAVGSTVNQNSMSRLITLNSVDDFCIWGPPTSSAADTISDDEAIVVAYCTKPRNGARLIPDGAITSAKFVKTPLYVQISGFWDGTKANFQTSDVGGGELDPHGATGAGNPIGGNVTSNVSGGDVFYEEWMSYVSSTEYCLRICTAQNSNITAALECQHTIDLLGCNWVMALGPTEYSSEGTFVSCDGDAAAGPGLYPQADGSTSTFAQRYTGSYLDSNSVYEPFTVGVTVTPSAPAFIPATSNCVSYTTIANGVNTANFLVTASPTLLSGGATISITPTTAASSKTSAVSSGITSGASSAATGTGSTSKASSGASSATSAAATSAKSGALPMKDGGMSGVWIALGMGAVGLTIGAMEIML